MITPTQSQIDAALNFLNDLFARSTIRVINLNDVVETIRTLTAAAQVGEFDNRYEPRHYRTLNEEAKYWDQPEKETMLDLRNWLKEIDMRETDVLAKQALDTFRAGFSGDIPPPMSEWEDAPPSLRDVLRIAVMVGQLNKLTAAAQVGELPQVQFTRTEAEYNKLKSEAEISIIALQGEISRTIERCKQIIIDYLKDTSAEQLGETLSAALDKLKDEP